MEKNKNTKKKIFGAILLIIIIIILLLLRQCSCSGAKDAGAGVDSKATAEAAEIVKIKVDVPSPNLNLTYNGEEQVGVTLPEDAVYTLSGNTGKNASDSYVATATLKDKNQYEWNLSEPTSEDQTISWSISPKSINAYAKDQSSDVGDDLVPLTFVADYLIGEDRYSGALTTNADKDVPGAYWITQGSLTAGSNYSLHYSRGLYTVNEKAAPIVTLPVAKTGLVYTGEAQELISAGSTSDGEWQYKLGDGTYSTDLPKATNAGTYKVYYKIVGGSNYKDEVSCEVTIAKAYLNPQLDYTIKPIDDKFNEVELTGMDNPNYGTVQYALIEDGKSSDDAIWQSNNTFEIDKDKDYYAIAKYSGDNNYEGGQVQTITFCLAVGTKITMADGTFKNIEDIVAGDEVLTYNHEKGCYEGQKVWLAWKGEGKACAFTLHFTHDVSISVIGLHDFFEKEGAGYVTIEENNAESFIGKHFYNATAGRYEKLLSVTYEIEPVEYYELYTEYNGNWISDDLLGVAHDSSEMLNMYEFNKDLSIDHEQFDADLAEFGLYEYPEDATYPKEYHDTLGWKYAKLWVGKGLTTWEDLFSRRDALLGDTQ